MASFGGAKFGVVRKPVIAALASAVVSPSRGSNAPAARWLRLTRSTSRVGSRTLPSSRWAKGSGRDADPALAAVGAGAATTGRAEPTAGPARALANTAISAAERVRRTESPGGGAKAWSPPGEHPAEEASGYSRPIVDAEPPRGTGDRLPPPSLQKPPAVTSESR